MVKFSFICLRELISSVCSKYPLPTRAHAVSSSRHWAMDGVNDSQGRIYVGAGGTCPSPQIHLLPLIQKLADRSDVISEVPKCSKIQIFRGAGNG